MWRWAFLPPQYQQHDQVYASMWQSLLRWLISSVGLVPGRDLVLRTDKVTYASGESISALLLRREDSAAVKTFEVELAGEDGGSSAEDAAGAPGGRPGGYCHP